MLERNQERRSQSRLRVYRCGFCRAFHLGNAR
jgi:hypothetical protein